MIRYLIDIPEEHHPQFMVLLAQMRSLPRIKIEEKVLDPLDFGVQLDTMRDLANGWLDGEGLAPNPKGLDWLAGALSWHWPQGLTKPWLCATGEGNIEAEWNLGKKDASLEIDLQTHTAYWHLLDLETDTFEERNLDLNLAKDWRWLTEQIYLQEGGTIDE
jgi:hypothetical protein